MCTRDAVVHAEPVRVVASDFVDSKKPLVGISLEWMERGTTGVTDANGVLMLDADVGSTVTINFAGDDAYHQTQGVTVTVPPGGLTTELNEIVMQVPSLFTYDLFFLVTPGHKNTSACQLVVTVCNVNKTVHDPAQGLPGTVATLTPPTESTTFYFGTWGKWSNATNPLPNNLTSTSFDGGVLFENIPPNANQWYEVQASHVGYTFTTTRFRCTQGGLFINGAPNQGPRATPVSKQSV